MSKEDLLRMSGVVEEVLPNAMFRVVLENNHKIVISDYENEIYKLKFEIENLEIEKNILEKDLNRDYNDKNSILEIGFFFG